MEQKVDRKQSMRYPRYALISVADKTGIENVARALCDFGFDILCQCNDRTFVLIKFDKFTIIYDMQSGYFGRVVE